MKYIRKIIEKETELSIKFNNKSLTPRNIPPLGQKERNEVKIKQAVEVSTRMPSVSGSHFRFISGSTPLIGAGRGRHFHQLSFLAPLNKKYGVARGMGPFKLTKTLERTHKKTFQGRLTDK